MSKKVNKKKNTRNNYKIESLEPRLMMDANIDYGNFVEQIENYEFSQHVDDAISSAGQNVDSSFSEALSKLELDGISKVEDFFSDIRTSAETKWDDLKNVLNLIPSDERTSLTVSGLADRINNAGLGLNASASGNKLVISAASLQSSATLNKLNLGDFAMDLQNAVSSTANASMTIDFTVADPDDENSLLNASLGGVDLNASVKLADLSSPVKFMNMSLSDGEVDGNDLELGFSYASSNTFETRFLMDIELELNSGNWPFKFKDNQQLEVTKLENGGIEFVFPEIEFDDSSFNLHSLLNGLDAFEIPFLEKLEFNIGGEKKSISEIASIADEYWARTSLALNAAVEQVGGSFVLKMVDLKNCFDMILNGSSGIVDVTTLLQGIEIVDSTSKAYDLLSSVTLNDTDVLDLSSGELVLRFMPKIGFNGNVNFGLFELGGIEAGCAIEVKLNVGVDSNGCLLFNSISLEKLDLTISTQKQDHNIDIGLFAAEIKGCELNYAMSLKKKATGEFEIVSPVLKVDFDSAELKSGKIGSLNGISICKVDQSEPDRSFEYNFSDAEWKMPEKIKKFVSLSGDTLEQQLVSYLNSLQSSLRSLIREKVNLDVLGDSADKVVDVIDKIDEIIYGFERQSVQYEGLIKADLGTFKANFKNVETFVEIFNRNWIAAFGITDQMFDDLGMAEKKVCSLKYIDEKGNEILNKAADALEETAEGSVESVFKKYRIDFNLFFNVNKSIDLDFANKLGNAFANVSTDGKISFEGNAGFKFSLNVDFSSEKIEDSTTIGRLLDLKTDEVLSDDDYWTLDVDFSKYSVVEPFKFEVVESIPGVAGQPDTQNRYAVNVQNGSLDERKFDVKLNGSTSNAVSFVVTNNQQILVLCDNPFDINSSGSGDSFAELKLLNARLQTTFVAKNVNISTGSVGLSLNGVYGAPNALVSLNFEEFDKALNEGLVQGDNLVAQLNDFLSLQDDDDFCVTNKYGIYALEAEFVSVGVYNIRFACDQGRLKVREKDSFNNVKSYKLANPDSQYMRVSGVLQATGVIYSPDVERGFIIQTDSNGKIVESYDYQYVFDNETGTNSASEQVNALNAMFASSGNWYSGKFTASCESKTVNVGGKDKTVYIVRVINKVESESIQRKDNAQNSFGVKESDKVLVLHVSHESVTENVYVNTADCLTSSSLANAIENAIAFKNLNSLVKAVSLVDNKIVFTVVPGATVSVDGFNFVDLVALNIEATTDFQIVGTNPVNIDFKNVANEATTVQDFVVSINTLLSGTGIELLYSDPSNSVKWDHLELRGDKFFSLKNCGASSILKQLGFDPIDAKEYGDGTYRIVGAAILGCDWSKLITLQGLGAAAEIELFADLSLNVVDAKVSADISVVNLDAVVNGSVGVHGSFKAIKQLDRDEEKDENGFQEWTFAPSFSLDQNSEFTLTPSVTLGGQQWSFDPLKMSLTDGNTIGLSFNADDFVTSVTDKFGNFSMEDVYAILESIVKQISSFVEKSDVKIPVINKSVGELVSVANDIRDIVAELRRANISNLQTLQTAILKRLKDFGLETVETGKELFNIESKIEDEKIYYDFNFNIKKLFSTVQQFSFGTAGCGVSGNADLNVDGSFWFDLSARASFTDGKFDLVLNKQIDFGASVDIVGEKLSFNLGIDADSVALLKNIITVGSNDQNSFVCAKVSLDGSLGGTGFSFKKWEVADNFVCNIPFAVYGKLPISVTGYALGDVWLGKCTDGNLDKTRLTVDEAKSFVEEAIADYKTSENVFLLNKIKDAVPDDPKPNDNGVFAVALKQGDLQGLKGDRFVVDFSEVMDRIDEIASGNIDWFDKIKLAVTGLNTLLDSLESSMNGGLMRDVKSVPVVGNVLSTGADFLTLLKSKVLEPFSNYVYESTGLTAKMLAEKMNVLFADYFYEDKLKGNETKVDVNILPDSSESLKWLQIGNQGTYYRSGADEDRGNFAEWFFRLGKDYSFGTDVGLDFGFPGLGLEADGGVNLSLNWNLEFGFGVSENGGFYFIFGDGNDLSVTADASLNAAIMGKLAGLGLVLDAQNADVILSFGVDVDQKSGTPAADAILIRSKTITRPNKDSGEPEEVTDSKNFKALKISEALGQLPKFFFDASVYVNADITVGIASDLSIKADADAPKFPNITGTFEFEWKKAKGGVTKLGFGDLEIQMGLFISDVLGPIVAKIQKVVEPLKPLIDFLTTPFPVLDDLGLSITPLDLAKKYSKGKFDDSMVYAIKDLIAMAEKISNIKSSVKGLSLPIGSFNLIREGFIELNGSANNLLNGSAANTSLDKIIDEYRDSKKDIAGDAAKQLASNGLNVGSGAWRFFWDKPQDIFKLLLGQDIPLVEYDMPKLSFDFNWDTFIRIWGPLGARLGVSLNATIDLGFGYDTAGVRQWIDSGCKDYGRLLNGFYVNDYDQNGNDKAELSFYGGLTAAAELNAGVSAGVGGGVGINVNFNLYDPNKDGKIRLNEITQLFKSEGLFGFFDVDGAITAKLYAYVDLLFYTKKWNITGDITLFEFELSHKTTPVMNTENADGNLVANVGDNASSRVADDGSKGLEMNNPNETIKETIAGKIVTDDFGKTYEVKSGRYIVPAGDGIDKIILSGSADFDIEIDAGAGDDIIDLSGLTMDNNHAVVIKGGAGVDTIIGAHGLNIIFGDEGVLRVDDEKDENGIHQEYRLVAESNIDAHKAGGDIILGGSSRDIIFGGAGDDQIDGGSGEDYIFGDAGSWSIRADVEETLNSMSEDEKKNLAPNEFAWMALSNIAKSNAIATNKKDIRISRTEIGLDGGNDTLIGGDDDDEIHGGIGDDHIDGGAGKDIIYGEKGHDRILGGSGDDTIHGGEGMDIVFGDRIEGLPKDVAEPFAIDKTTDEKKKAAFSQEFIEAQFKDGNTSVSDAEFKIKVDKGADYYKNYTDEIKNRIGDDGILDYSDDASSDNGNDTIYGEDGNDLLFGDDGSDTNVNGGTDKIYGGIGNDIIDGDGGNDTIEGGIDNDIIYGGLGDDNIDGGAGNDSLYGDNGVTDYDALPTDPTKKLTGNTNNVDKVVFGDNLGLHGAIYEGAESKTLGGNDKIVTGPGMDFVDGQGGSDKVTVKLMGESSVGYANVTDSGKDGADTLAVEGTEEQDELLMRMNKDHNLGFVALLPQDKEAPENKDKGLALNTNIERVNFTNSIETVNLNANGGDDHIVIDGTAKTTNVDGGDGADTIQVGQLYNSERVFTGGDKDPAKVQPVDAFDTVKTNEEKYLSEGVTKNTILNVEGNIGEDTFAALNNVGALNMVGGKGDDKFSIYGFQNEKDATIARGPVSIDGGSGNDSMFVRGTNGDDTVVLSKEGLLSNVVSVKAAGVETSTFDAAAGDDLFNVIGNNKGEVHSLNGGKGNDTFNMGSLDADYTLRGSSTEGQACDIKYEVFDASNKLLESTTESFTVMDTSNEPVVFVSSKADGIETPELTIGEGQLQFFYLHFAGDKLNNQDISTITVNLTAPMLSEKALQSGAREIMLAQVPDSVSGDVSAFDPSWNWLSTLPVTLTTVTKCVKIAVYCFADNLVEEESLKSISVSCECDGTALTKSVSSIALNVNKDNASRSGDVNKLLAYAEEFNVSGNTVQLCDIAGGAGVEISAYVVGQQGIMTNGSGFSVDAASRVLTLDTPLTQAKLVVVYRSGTMRIDSSKAHLAYDDVDISKINVEYKADGANNFVNVNTLTDITWKRLGDTLVFYNASNKRMMTLHGELKITPKIATATDVFLPPEAGLAAAGSGAVIGKSNVVVEPHGTILAESGIFNSVELKVSYNGDFAGGAFVKVRISVMDAVNALDANGNYVNGKELEFVDAAGNPISSSNGEYVELTFTPENASVAQVVTLRAKSDTINEEYGYVTVHETEDERINGIEGAVYAFGMGASVDLDVDSPTMLSYAHKVEVVGAANAITHEEANKYNEKNDYDASKLLGFTQVKGNKLVISIASTNAVLDALGIKLNDEHSFEGKTIRFVANDSEGIKIAAESEDENDKYIHESVWFKIISCEAEGNKFTITLNEAVSLFNNGNSKVLFSSSKDYLFIDEDASVDRLFVNNKSDEEAKSSSLNAFAANSGILAEGELAEFGDSAETIRKNIQEAESAVDAYDRHAVRFEHDDIGKRGITAAQMEYAEYNLGTGKDTVDINKTLYREDAFRTYTVVNTGDAKDRDAAFGISIGKAEISSDNLTNGANYITDSNVYKYDLIPAEGSEISVIKTSANTTVYYVQAEIRKLNSESETGYDVVGIQRREVLGSFSSTMGFYVKYDFILAEGEYIGEFEFFQAEFDDYIRVNSYKADEASADNVICSGVIAEVAPVQEETGDDNAETGDEPDTEGDGEATEGDEDVIEGDGEETTPAEEVAGFAYSYAMAESDAAEFENRMATFQAWQSGLTSAANGYVYGIFVDATMGDGSVQRRFVTELTANTFRISRDFTLSEGLSIVSLRFAYSFEGDGQLVVNAQAGHDRIDASSSDVTRNDMVAFGGFGDDYITMNKGGIAFGDRGQVRYENGQVNGKDVYETILGSTDGDGNHNNGLDYTTGIDKRAEEDTNEQPQYRLQTDGVNRDASEIRSMDDSNEQNGIDLINVGGTNSVVIGGDKADVIVIGGDKNVALGDNGRVLYNNAQNDNAVYGDKLGLGMHIVETTSDDIGDVDNIVIGGDKNVAMGGAKGDSIRITGADNVAIGDGGRYTIEETRLYAESKTDDIGGQDFISTGDGKNAVIGGTDKDWIYTGAGNDAIIGDGGKVIMDTDRNALMVTNEGRNIKQIDKDEQVSIIEDNSAGADHIEAGNGDNVVFGGLDSDDITTGNGQDVVFGDNAYATFRGNANEAFEQVGDRQNVPDVYEEATLSFNFQGASQTGLNAGDFVGAYNEQYGDDYRSSNWNNISGSLAGTYGNDDREVVNMDNLDATGEKSADETRVRASGVSVSYGGIESHRNTSTDNRINLQAYNLGLWNAQYDKNAKLMNSGLMTTAPNAQCENKLDVQMDGLAQYFTSYRVVVYLDIPDSHSAADNSVRKVSLYTNDSEDPIKTFYVKDNAGHNFHGSYERSTAETAASAMEANYVVFTVDEGVAADRIRVVIEEADPNAQNGKNLPGIAAIQVRGTLHKQDVAATTDIDFGGNDTIRTDLGDDIVVGGTGSDDITTFGDERYGIHDNDVVFGDNAKILLTDRDSDESTASTISTAESVAITNIDAIYDDLIKTGNGNDTVVGGVGADTINAEATAAADTMLEDINVLSINFTREHSDSTDAIAQGEAAGVVVDTDWHNFYRNDRGVIVSESVRGQESSPEYNNKMNSLSNNPTASNPYAVEEGVEVQLYGKNHGQRQTVASFTIENYDELDGDTSNSKLFNTYLAAQQSEEIVLKLKNMNSFVSNSNNTVSSTYDLYIYLGGDNNDTDTYNYLYQVKFTGHNGVSQYRYLNDWTGHKFDGDYKEATCSSQTEAERMLQMALNDSAHDSAAPRLELVGNYVVFRGVSGDVADIRIKNIYTSSGQHPKNLPMISAVQVVSGDGRYAGETDLGGDHDKDLVYGDDAKLVFDMDVPYDADVADVSKFKNRVIEAKSVAIEHDAVTSISTNDTITTGRDRDVAVGGEGADTITMGEGDDIALGGSANLVLEHNNPLGVFTPNTEIALDQHTIDTTQHQNYLDNDNANKWQFQSRLDQNHIQGIDTSVSNENDRKDTIDVGEGRNLTSQGSDSTAQLVVPKPVIVDDDGQEGSGEASTPTPPVVAPDDGTVVIDQEGTSTLVEIAAGETVEIVITDWDEGNQYYHPNVFLQLNCSDNTRHKLSVTWDGQQTDPTVYLQNYAEFDIPDVATVVGEHKIVLRITSRDSISLMATVAHR